MINDHVGNAHRHGLPTDPRAWSLQGRPPASKRAAAVHPVRVCPSCFATIPAAQLTCPECGHTIEQMKRELTTVEGSLHELTPQQHAINQRKQVARARSREELEVIRLERGYSRGWTDHILRARSKYGPSHA